jgi:hypothetical protein
MTVHVPFIAGFTNDGWHGGIWLSSKTRCRYIGRNMVAERSIDRCPKEADARAESGCRETVSSDVKNGNTDCFFTFTAAKTGGHFYCVLIKIC